VVKPEDDFQDSYHDDPIGEISRTKSRAKFFTTGLLLLGSIFFFQTTFAGNISLSSSSPVEFGQGFTATTACSDESQLTLTPTSAFTNVAGAGSYKFSSLTVSGIPESCRGKDFTINAFGNTGSSPLAIFNSDSTSAVVYNNAGTFELGVGTITGTSITSGSGAFTITYLVPVATSESVFRITLQSGMHSDVVYKVGNIGPGGGKIYYASSTGFNCGANYTATGSPTGGLCKYLEVAPNTWSGSSDPLKYWAVKEVDLETITSEATAYNNAAGIGLGYKNSIAIVSQNGVYPTNNYAAGAARAYTGGSKSDWYLASTAELNLLCQWARNVTQNVATRCTGGALNTGTGAGAGFIASYNWSSSERDARYVHTQNFSDGFQGWGFKNYAPTPYPFRPIRAF